MTPAPFVHTALPGRVLFGPGRLADVPAEVARLEARRVFLIAGGQSKGVADELAAPLGDVLAARWHEVAQHVPVALAERAREAAHATDADVVVCVGGGSAVGLAKAVALTTRLPIVAVPTTYSGSEQTTIYGLTATVDQGRTKRTGSSPDVLPRVVVYDPLLTLDLPPSVTGPSAFNALAHAVEALYAPGHDPMSSLIALEGVRTIADALPAAIADGADVDARSGLLYGAYLAGVALGAAGTGLHHKLCHVLGGTFDLVHADAHGAVLPHAAAVNAPALPTEMAALAEALGRPGDDPAGALWDLARASSVPTSLASLGLRADVLPEAARRTAEAMSATSNPVPVDAETLLALLQRAHVGARP